MASMWSQDWLWIGLLVSGALLAGATVALLRLRSAHRQLQAHHTELEGQARIQRAILDSMGDGVVVADAQGKLLLVNPAAGHLVGIGVSSVYASDWSRQYGIYLPDRATPYPLEELPLARAIRGESSDGVELYVANPMQKEAGGSA
jgi:PAS domain-containing protein